MKISPITILCLGAAFWASTAYSQQKISDQDAQEIARDAYVYAYPLVLMHVTSGVSINVIKPEFPASPINQLANARAFPDPSFTIVVRPNADTLYSVLTFDVRKEPLVFSIPNSDGRFYLLPFMDFWTDVFAVPGTRTTGNDAQTFAIVGPKWGGKLPDGIKRYDSPTGFGALFGRTQTNGKADYEAVHKFQAGMKVVPLSSFGKPY